MKENTTNSTSEGRTYLVGGFNPTPLIVTWDDEIPNMMGKPFKIPYVHHIFLINQY
jgi:hypothetical protein